MGTLENISLWHKYKTACWPTTKKTEDPEEKGLSEVERTIHNAMRLVRSFYTPSLGYINCPISSGKAMYDMIEEEPLLRHMPQELQSRTINENFVRGYTHFDELKKTGKNLLFPALFSPAHQRWEQPEFQALWLNIIAEKVTTLYPVDDWEYSTGAAEEFTHAYQLKLGAPKSKNHEFRGREEDLERWNQLNVIDARGEEISLEQGLAMIDQAIVYIKERYAIPERLINCRNVLEQTGELLTKGFSR